MSLTISTIIPTHNVAEHIGEAIQSVLDQTRSPIEIFIIDDCSTDNTVEVVRSFNDPRITVLSTASNSGSGTARNIGIRAATGNLIALLDGDDYWMNDHLEIVAALFDEHPAAALAFSSTEAFGSQSWVWPIRIPSHQAVNCFWDCIPRTIVPQMNVVMRRTAVLEAGGYREELKQSQDFDLFLRMAYRWPFVCSQQVTTRYRRHEGSITLRNPNNALHCIYKSRWMLSQEMAGTASPEEIERFNRACLEQWEIALSNCVIRRNWRLMDFHLGQARYVPGADAHLLGWRMRRAAGTLQWMWDIAHRPLRKAA